jgi:Tfp pilus assembly protein PilE
MNWLLENPVPAIIVGGLTAAMLGGGWLQTGAKWLLYLAITAVILTILAVIMERVVVTDREQVTETLFEIAALVERNQVDEALKYASPKSPRVRAQAASELPLYEFSDVDIKRNLEIELLPDANPPTAIAEFNVSVTLSIRNSAFTNRRIPRFVEVTFYKEEDGQWRVGAYQHFEPTRGFRTEKESDDGFSPQDFR